MSSNVGIDNYNKNKFVCYFCNNEIQGESEIGHNAVCSSVLVPCPNKCGVYTPRKDVMDHDRKCPQKTRWMTQQKTALYSKFEAPVDDVKPCKGCNSRSGAMTPDKSFITELSSLHHRCSILEQYLSNIAMSSRNKSLLDSKELDRLAMQNRFFDEWRDIINLKLENLRKQLVQEERSKLESKENWDNLRQYLLIFEKFKIDVSNIKETLKAEQNQNKQNNAETYQRLNSIKECLDQQCAKLISSLNDQKEFTDKLNTSLIEQKKSFDEITAKYTALNFDMKALTSIATEASEKLEMQQRDFVAMQKEFNQMKIDLEILGEKPDNIPASTGRLLWKIVNVDSRMKRAKETGSFLQSPVFYTHEFGYKVKVLIYLNGLNKWKDRYCLLSLCVLKGEYDMTLKWPCDIEGTISLRDIQNLDNAKNVKKVITARRSEPGEPDEDPQEASSSYIFIPHGTLTKTTYLKDQTLFLDIRITRIKKLNQESDL